MTPRLNGASDPPEPAQTAMVSIDLLISGVASCTGRVREPKATPFVRSWCGVGGRRFGGLEPTPRHASPCCRDKCSFTICTILDTGIRSMSEMIRPNPAPSNPSTGSLGVMGPADAEMLRKGLTSLQVQSDPLSLAKRSRRAVKWDPAECTLTTR
jgi:hypothetical protein